MLQIRGIKYNNQSTSWDTKMNSAAIITAASENYIGRMFSRSDHFRRLGFVNELMKVRLVSYSIFTQSFSYLHDEWINYIRADMTDPWMHCQCSYRCNNLIFSVSNIIEIKIRTKIIPICIVMRADKDRIQWSFELYGRFDL